ncbi:MAG TPA: glycosyl hydrolase [Candidatus Dormibacteraeota bacterium]|nr:glycosyl hydrolase [Candidatus Dormibacteraeota bacterium]
MKSIRDKAFGFTAAGVTLLVFIGYCLGQGSGAGDALERGFKNPPATAKPRVWWHWMNGNITKAGIKLDLEWMHRVGIGGFQNFDAALNTPQLVETRLIYMTPEWKEAFLYATTLADQLGLEEAIAGSPGWSESGGPWVKPAQAMKKLVWSETLVQGGQVFHGVLLKPPSTSGPFQNIPAPGFRATMSGQEPTPLPEYYADSAVIAYPLPKSEVLTAELRPKVTSSNGVIDVALLTDGDFAKANRLPVAPVGQEAWIQFEFANPPAIRALTVALGPSKGGSRGRPPGPELDASDDGKAFRKIITVPNDGAAEKTISFPEVTARFFRLSFRTPPAPLTSSSANAPSVAPQTADGYQITELVLHTGARVNRFEEKAAFATLPDLYGFPTSPVAAGEAVRKGDVVDLTSKMAPDGTLHWTAPPGRWVVLRMGYSLTGKTNHPASPEGTGLEVDKLNSDHVRAYMKTYLDNYKSAVGDRMGKRGLRCLISDSWEAGTQNWTDNLVAEFAKRRGYDPVSWLPVLTGRVIESSESSDRFLWDFRRTLSDLLTENHYDLLETILKERGMCHYGESHEEGRAFIGDGMEVKRRNDVPMAAMWTQQPGVNEELYGYNADIRESASVAHIYGQNLVAAESLTARFGAWAWSPATLKPTADKELAMGLNRFVLHTSVHQPLLDKTPGIGLGPYGQWFTRNETWAEQAKPWVTYLARNSYMLQQGRFVADVVYFYGEDSNLTSLFLRKAPEVPAGYGFDYINADALVHLLSVVDGQLATPSGMRYRVLALDPYSQHMSLPVLRKIHALVNSGAIVAGPKPISSPSLSDDQAEFRTIADQLWVSGSGEHSYGKGKVFAYQKLPDVLAAMNVTPDFDYTKAKSDTNLLFVHRKLGDGDLYYVDNRNDRAEDLDASFRMQGKQAEFWHADTGQIESASFRVANGRTTVPLQLEPWGTVFVVFRGPAVKESSRVVPKRIETPIANVEGPWDISFPENHGAPAKIVLDKLSSWSDNREGGVRYFSGTATYTKTVQAAPDWFKAGTQLWIDLGDVKNLAEVSVNGQSLGIVWKMPFRMDVSQAMKPGGNTIEIKVTNLWVNRMIGDRQPDAAKQYTFTSPTFYKADSSLLPSGLLGPVQILRFQ